MKSDKGIFDYWFEKNETITIIGCHLNLNNPR